jgi:hypothetical protein
MESNTTLTTPWIRIGYEYSGSGPTTPQSSRFDQIRIHNTSYSNVPRRNLLDSGSRRYTVLSDLYINPTKNQRF